MTALWIGPYFFPIGMLLILGLIARREKQLICFVLIYFGIIILLGAIIGIGVIAQFDGWTLFLLGMTQWAFAICGSIIAIGWLCSNGLVRIWQRYGGMNKRQLLVLFLGTDLLVLDFVLPYTSYPVIERSADGLSVRSTVKTGFMPFWTVQSEHEKALLEGNPFGDTYILWPWVFVFAAIIVVTSVWLIYRLGEPENAVSHEPIDEK